MAKKNERIFMKMKKIEVKNLFKIFHHEIPLNMKDHITIIHGPNGFGKTVLLTMLNALFSSRYHELRRIPFGMLEREVRGLERIGKETWIYFPTKEELSFEEVLDRFGDRLPIPRIRGKEEPAWLKEIKNS